MNPLNVNNSSAVTNQIAQPGQKADQVAFQNFAIAPTTASEGTVVFSNSLSDTFTWGDTFQTTVTAGLCQSGGSGSSRHIYVPRPRGLYFYSRRYNY